MPAEMLTQSPDGEVDWGDSGSTDPLYSLPLLPCALTVHGLPRVVDKLLRRLDFDHALVVHVTDTAIVVTAWNDYDRILRTFQVPVIVAAHDPSLAIDHGGAFELRHLTTSVEPPTFAEESLDTESILMDELPTFKLLVVA